LQRLERSFSSLAVCYAFLASLGALLLIYARLELQASPPDWSNLIGGFIHGSTSFHSLRGAQIFASLKSAFFALRERMHTTWLFLVVFATVWLGCLLWMQIERNRRGIHFSRREALWIVGFTLSVFGIAMMYGVGTNGILAYRFPGIVPVSDFLAVAFILVLPLAVWSWLDRLQEDQEAEEFADDDSVAVRSHGFLGLDDEATNARLVESLSRLEVKPVDLLPTVQAFHSEVPSQNAQAAAALLIETAEAPVAPARESAPPVADTTAAPLTPVGPIITPAPVVTPAPMIPPAAATPEPQVIEPTVIESAVPPVPVAVAVKPAETGIESFRYNLAAMNESWRRIEGIRGEIDEWFEVRRREALARLDRHPGARASAVEKALFDNFPNDKLNAVDSEWSEIRRAAFEISRWFGEPQ
jgi:hypothetical protein